MQKRLKQASIRAESEEPEDEVADDSGADEDAEVAEVRRSKHLCSSAALLEAWLENYSLIVCWGLRQRGVRKVTWQNRCMKGLLQYKSTLTASCHAADSLGLRQVIHHSLQDDSGEEEESTESEDDMEAEEEAEGLRRYSLRDRSRALVQRYSPRAGAGGAFSVGLKRRRSIVEQVGCPMPALHDWTLYSAGHAWRKQTLAVREPICRPAAER